MIADETIKQGAVRDGLVRCGGIRTAAVPVAVLVQQSCAQSINQGVVVVLRDCGDGVIKPGSMWGVEGTS